MRNDFGLLFTCVLSLLFKRALIAQRIQQIRNAGRAGLAFRVQRVFCVMKKLILMWAIILGWSGSAWSEGPGTLTTLRAIQALSNAAASQGLPAAFEATVTYSPGYQGLLFVQDGDLGIFVRDASDEKLVRGDRVLVKGKTSGSFRPIVISSSVTVLQHGALPLPEPATFDELAHVQRDAMLVTVRGVVRTADLRMNSTVRVTYLQDRKSVV